MTRHIIQAKINDMLYADTKGIFHDSLFTPVNAAFRKLEKAGFLIDNVLAQNLYNSRGQRNAKMWVFEIPFGKNPFYGIITAHGAGTVNDPLASYDVSAYVV